NGGYSAVSVLEYVDYEIVQNNPKPFIGFSDITNFHSAFYTKTGLVGFHMDLLTYSLGWLWNLEDFSNKEIAKELFVKALTSPEPFGDLPQITKWESWRTGKAKGKLFGGNLSMLSTIIGTEYFPSVTDLEGAILFWEIDNADLYRIERCLTEFKYNGVFDVISGMIVGKLPDMKKLPFEGIEHPTAKQLVLSILESYNFPIIGEVDFGHKTANVPMFVGLEASMDSDNLKISVLESALK
ncbi:LD-carboxypeptidase, partial [Candidatus Peregrinibacteria bacterium]|nr:LD-carboxypeptidase [Candidatus Peregrinibacteria bacterium]